MKNELISIVIPVYNVEKYIKKCLDSIICQTYKDIEIILIDDGSTDSSGKICDEYAKKDGRIRATHTQNRGVSQARNMGIELARGKYIAFVDSDDWLELNMYEEMHNSMVNNDVDVVKCTYCKDTDIESIEIENVFKQNRKVDMQIERDNILDLYSSKKMHADVCFMLIKKELVEKINKFDVEMILGEDLIFAIELMCVSRFVYFYNKGFYHYYTNMNSATKSEKKIEENLKNLLKLYCKIEKVTDKYNLSIEQKNKFALLCFNKICDQLKDGIKVNKTSSYIDVVLQDKYMNQLMERLTTTNLSLITKLYFNLIKNKRKNLLYFLICMRNKL